VLVVPNGDDVHARLKGKIGWRNCEAVFVDADDEMIEEPLRAIA
jgi:hypothetical protein